jgi:hypothetical protein
LKNGISEDAVDVIGSVFFDLTDRVGAEYFGAVAYGAAVMEYERKIEEHTAKGTSVGRVKAKELTAKMNVFKEEIGKKNCSELLRLGFFLRGFFVDGRLNPDAADRFSDEELLIFIKKIDIGGISAGKAGLELLLDYYADSLILKNETSYVEELLYEANYNGDAGRIFSDFEDLLILLNKVVKSLDKDDVGLMRQGEYKELIRSVFLKFDEESWEIFEKLTSVEIEKAKYEKIAFDFFGEDFSEYCSEDRTVSLSEVRLSINEENFYNKLEGYIYGISPAFSYGMKND